MWRETWDSHGTSALDQRQTQVKRPATAAARYRNQHEEMGRAKTPVDAWRPLSAEAVHTTDIWHSLIKDLVEETIPCSTQERKNRPLTARQHREEYSSSTGSVQIVDVQLKGLFVRLGNFSQKEQDIGSFCLQQHLAGRPIAEFRFPPRTLFKPSSFVTVWSEGSGRITQNPEDFLWAGLQQIMLGPECTTVLCNKNGQAIAWYTPACCTAVRPRQAWAGRDVIAESSRKVMSSQEETGSPATEVNCPDNATFLLVKRKKPTLRVTYSPWTQNPSSITHPACFPCAPLDFRAQPQGSPARPHTGVQTRRHISLHPQWTGVKGGPIRSAGPCVGGVMFLGPQPTCTSSLQQYRTAAPLHRHTKVITA